MYKTEKYNFYKSSSNSIFVELENNIENIQISNIVIDSLSLVSNKDTIRFCKIRRKIDFIKYSICDTFFLVDPNSNLLISDHFEYKLLFIVGNAERFKNHIAIDTIKNVSLDWLPKDGNGSN